MKDVPRENSLPIAHRRADFAFGIAFFFACLAIYFVVIGIGWNNTLLDSHGFRQTQTAISAYYLINGPFKLAYETPVLGPPWEIPFEFPLYQWIVAAIVSTLHTPLDQTGRFISVVVFLLTLIPSNSLLRKLRLLTCDRLLILGLLVVTPLYLFYSRTFMIETLVLFLSTSFLALAWHYGVVQELL